MTEQLNKNQLSKFDRSKDNELEIDLIGIMYRIVGIRKLLYKAAVIGLVIGIIVALSIPKQYTVRVTLSPEMGSTKGNNGLAGLAASFLGNGAAVGDDSDALNAALSADIVSSTPFLLELFDIQFTLWDKKEIITLKTYLDEQSSPWWDYIIGMPRMIVEGVKSLFDDDQCKSGTMKRGTIELTSKDASKIKILKKSITASVDKKTAITNISVTLQNPRVAAVIADSVIYKLQKYIIDYRTSKAKEDCIYLEKLFKERQEEYYAAQKKYADYVDSHDNLILQSIRTEQERLQNDMGLSYQVYSQVANQLQVARAKVQEEKPIFAVLEPAVVPLQTSNKGIKVYGLLFMFLSIACTMGWKLIGERIWNNLRNEIETE